MNSYLQHYIDGRWTDSEGGRRHEVVNPATEEVVSVVTLGSQADVDKARRLLGYQPDSGASTRVVAWAASSKRATSAPAVSSPSRR